MTRVAVTKLKAQLSQYLARVKAGEEVIVTERNLPIAKLVPIPMHEGIDERMLDLERRGIVKIYGDGRIPQDFIDRHRDMPPTPGRSLLSYLLEERDEGW